MAGKSKGTVFLIILSPLKKGLRDLAQSPKRLPTPGLGDKSAKIAISSKYVKSINAKRIPTTISSRNVKI